MLFRRTSSNAQSRRAPVGGARPLEALEDRRLMSVTSLSLYNAVDDVSYGALNEGASVSFVQLNTWGITITAETSGAVGSVRWAFDGNDNYATENYAPYAIAGDTDGGNLSPWAPPSVGTHTVKVTAFTGQNGTGSVINSMTRTFSVADQPYGPGGVPVVAGPTVSFSDPEADGSEQGLDPGIWTISRTGSTASSLTVNYAVGGSATNGVDYNRLSGSIVIPAGRSTVDLIVKPIQDSAVEGTENVVVTLATSGSYALGGAITATSPIFDNDTVSSPTPTPTPTPTATGINDITWSRNAPRAPEPKTEAGVVQVGSKIYSIGGFTAKGGSGTFFPLTRRVYSYDMATRSYKELAALPSQAAGNHFGAASDGQNIYAVAGQLEATYGKGTSTAWKYNIATNKWTQFNSLPQIRFGGTAFVDNGWLHFVGGNTADRTTVSRDHWAINLSNTSAGWQRKASIPLGGDHMSHARINGRHYLFGGEHSHKGLNGSGGGGYIQHNYTFEYNASNDTWTRKANMPLAISHIEGSTLVINNKAVLIGGLLDGGDDNTTSRVQVYDPVSNTWKSLSTRYPKRIIGASAGYWNGKIYMSEGFSPDESDRQVGFEGTVKFG